jgi:hypothetical protein
MGYFTIIINNYIYLLKIKQPRKPIRATARQAWEREEKPV